MAATDKLFAGSIPEIYDRFLVPLIFEAYARDLAERVARVEPREVLETAAGTGVLTRAIAARLPAPARMVVTDLNQPMLDHAQRQSHDSRITWRQADALALPFEDQKFDVVACQFGAMFFPDKVQGYREARRVLKPGGHFFFNVGPTLRKRVCRCRNASAGDALSARPASLHGTHPAWLSRCGKNPRGAHGGGI
jgi:ubiquinone/menaquinone biosynthesis C-methylase UbiE